MYHINPSKIEQVRAALLQETTNLIFLSGTSGVGRSYSISILSLELHYDLTTFNPFFNKNQFSEILTDLIRNHKKCIIVVDDIDLNWMNTSNITFQTVLKRFSEKTSCSKIVFIIPDHVNVVSSVTPLEHLEIKFNAVAQTFLKRYLGIKSGKNKYFEAVMNCGDLRSAKINYEFLSLLPNTKTVLSIGKDNTLAIFHALVTSGIDSGLFNLFLLENMISFISEVHVLSEIIDLLSKTDCLNGFQRAIRTLSSIYTIVWIFCFEFVRE
ncbi:hypothetical protein O9G_001943 [Rozella allomycis CSF55]|uniref:ATPase AAA-type core domain-containing protein n=1 Tax=Rozella allomycis (strain CSF55) TaxID=988480 RepID=A0A075APG5_ROZAC|nr:hypothetical protein O9G_001943 [Rozella allomycis CSF55]|eukprot:EPZ31933.1 hypothetical protein O9G_001943 [Rozella allomycis CSF55]